MIDQKVVRDYAELYMKYKSAQKKYEGLKKLVLILEDRVRDIFIEAETTSLKTDKFICFLKRELQVGVDTSLEAESEERYAIASNVLINTGYGHLVQPRFNINSLKAVVRNELITDDLTFDEGMERVPDEWSGIIKIHQNYRVGVRQSARARKEKTK